MENMLIRDATAADLRALCVLRNSVAAHGAKLLEAERGTVRFLVAAAGAEIVGFATLFLANPKTGPAKSHIPKLSDCFVATNYRSRGIGRALVSARESIARLERHTRLFVSVDPVENPVGSTSFDGGGTQRSTPNPTENESPGTRKTAESKKCSCGARIWSWTSMALRATTHPRIRSAAIMD